MNHLRQAIEAELARAKALHPNWPTDLIHQAAIMAEEAGEAVRAALNVTYHGGSIEDVRTELVQTAAMCLRMMEAMDRRHESSLDQLLHLARQRREEIDSGATYDCTAAPYTVPCVWPCRWVGPLVRSPMECAKARVRK